MTFVFRIIGLVLAAWIVSPLPNTRAETNGVAGEQWIWKPEDTKTGAKKNGMIIPGRVGTSDRF